MTVKVRQYRRGGWEVDIRFKQDDGTEVRERVRSPVASESGSARWGEARQADLMRKGPVAPPEAPSPVMPSAGKQATKTSAKTKEVPTLSEFKPRFLNGYAKANRQKPSTINTKEYHLRVHLEPALGKKPLDKISNEDIQRLKASLATKSGKTVNNIISTLRTMLKVAIEWEVIETMPRIKMVKFESHEARFYEFDAYLALVEAAKKVDPRIHAVVLLAGDAGLRRGEIMALKWTDIDWRRRQVVIARSIWRIQETTTKGNRVRVVPMTVQLEAALKAIRHLRGDRVFYTDGGLQATARVLRRWYNRAQRLANLSESGLHMLRHTFCSHLAMKGAPAKAIQELAGHQSLTTTLRYMHLSPAARVSAIKLLEDRTVDGSLETNPGASFGDALETRRGG